MTSRSIVGERTWFVADSASTDLLEVAQHVDAPVLLVQGGDDPRP